MHVTCVQRYLSDIMLFSLHGWYYGRKKLLCNPKCPNSFSPCSNMIWHQLDKYAHFWRNFLFPYRTVPPSWKKMVAILNSWVARVLFFFKVVSKGSVRNVVLVSQFERFLYVLSVICCTTSLHVCCHLRCLLNILLNRVKYVVHMSRRTCTRRNK